MEFSVAEKIYICNHDHLMTTGKIAQKLGRNYMDVYKCYSNMVDTGEYIKLKTHAKKTRGKTNERKRDNEESDKQNGKEDKPKNTMVFSNRACDRNLFNTMWASDTQRGAIDYTRASSGNNMGGGARLRSAIKFAKRRSGR